MVMGLPAPGPDGPCPLYFRDRPHGCKKEKRATMLQNRIGEPEWYRYYRCQHFGYHPTIWTPWPENWLMCRPAPGKHPYDTAGSDPKLLKADAEREQQRLERGPLNSTQPPPLRPQEVDAPQPLPRDQ